MFNMLSTDLIVRLQVFKIQHNVGKQEKEETQT
jgi:hypothetical protein